LKKWQIGSSGQTYLIEQALVGEEFQLLLLPMAQVTNI